MKTVTKFFMAALLAGICSFGYGQTQPDYMKAPKPNEKLMGNIKTTYSKSCSDATDVEIYMKLLADAQEKYPKHIVDIRDVTYTLVLKRDEGNCYYREYSCLGKVISLSSQNPSDQANENLSKAMDKALRNVREGSRVAIDMVTVSGGVSINREDLKDQIIDALLDKGYKVVAKDYLEKMYEEQEAQQSGIYNENTTVKENNFSAVGYYINVKFTETSLRVQVVNVSTGEYEGNATVNF